MEKTINVVNRLQSDGIITKYAVGGGIAVLFYIEPFITFDLDVFVILPESSELLISLSPIYNWLDKHGYKAKKEQIIIEGIPVQFIPVYNDLVKESVENAIQKKFGQSEINVLRPEYLIAIMIQTSRIKDKERLLKLLDETKIDKQLLNKILIKHNLKQAFDTFKGQYYG